jgi:hypothetical protein
VLAPLVSEKYCEFMSRSPLAVALTIPPCGLSLPAHGENEGHGGCDCIEGKAGHSPHGKAGHSPHEASQLRVEQAG